MNYFKCQDSKRKQQKKCLDVFESNSRGYQASESLLSYRHVHCVQLCCFKFFNARFQYCTLQSSSLLGTAGTTSSVDCAKELADHARYNLVDHTNNIKNWTFRSTCFCLRVGKLTVKRQQFEKHSSYCRDRTRRVKNVQKDKLLVKHLRVMQRTFMGTKPSDPKTALM